MRILITGGTGLIGRALCTALAPAGHDVTVLSREPATVAKKCGPKVTAMGSLRQWDDTRTFDAIINLAGAPIIDAGWTKARKKVIWDSRVTLTEKVVERIALARQKPAVLLSGSAIGYYGDQGDRELDESAKPADDFPSQLCVGWEQAAEKASKLGVRVCLLRTGLVLARDGGMLAQMRTPFSLGLGTRLGGGGQWMSWIHIDDYVAIVLRLLEDTQVDGPVNMTAPKPVTNREFTASLAKALRRPAIFVAPAWLLKAALGPRAILLLGSERVLPKRIEEAGYSFRYADLRSALQNLLG